MKISLNELINVIIKALLAITMAVAYYKIKKSAERINKYVNKRIKIRGQLPTNLSKT